MFAVIHVPDFRLQAVLRRSADYKSALPAALIDSDPANAAKVLILECTEGAKAAGVLPGLTAPQAQARCRELVLKTRSPEAEQEATNILLQTAYAFTPHIEDTAPGVCTIDLRGLNFSGEAGRAVLSAPRLQRESPENPEPPPPSLSGRGSQLVQRLKESLHLDRSEDRGTILPLPWGENSPNRFAPCAPEHGQGARPSDAALGLGTRCAASECRAPVHGEGEGSTIAPNASNLPEDVPHEPERGTPMPRGGTARSARHRSAALLSAAPFMSCEQVPMKQGASHDREGRAALSSARRGEAFRILKCLSDSRRGEDTASYLVVSHEVAQQQSFGFIAEVERPAPRGESESHRLLSDWAKKILVALRQLNLEAQIGLAAAPNLALLAAQAAAKGSVFIVEHADEFFAHLPIEALSPAPHVLNILKRWGIHTAGAFLALGRDAVAERLGAEALELFDRASTDTIRPLNIVVPPDTFEERMDFEAQIETLEPLLFVLRRFVEQLATRIALTYRVVAELELTLMLETGAPHQRTFKVPAPTANVETLFRMLHTHLENLRTDAPIQSLRLAATPTRAEGQQFSLFESALRDPNHFHETLARLTALLGADRVGTPVAEPTHRPDAFRMSTPAFGNGQSPMANGQPETQDSKSATRPDSTIRNPQSAIRNSAGLCLRRFRSPLHADVELNHGQPTFLSTLLMSARIKRARGPWCMSGTWWDQRRWSRQEWDVETEKGELYRVRNAEGGWMVEGLYD